MALKAVRLKKKGPPLRTCPHFRNSTSKVTFKDEKLLSGFIYTSIEFQLMRNAANDFNRNKSNFNNFPFLIKKQYLWIDFRIDVSDKRSFLLDELELII